MPKTPPTAPAKPRAQKLRDLMALPSAKPKSLERRIKDKHARVAQSALA